MRRLHTLQSLAVASEPPLVKDAANGGREPTADLSIFRCARSAENVANAKIERRYAAVIPAIHAQRSENCVVNSREADKACFHCRIANDGLTLALIIRLGVLTPTLGRADVFPLGRNTEARACRRTLARSVPARRSRDLPVRR